jgi:hypothetical protein
MMKKRMADYVAPKQVGALKASQIVIRKARDCSKLTIEQLEFLALTPGNADCAEELQKRQAR